MVKTTTLVGKNYQSQMPHISNNQVKRCGSSRCWHATSWSLGSRLSSPWVPWLLRFTLKGGQQDTQSSNKDSWLVVWNMTFIFP